VSNGKIIEKKIFENVWVQPASGDAGCALGVALDVWHSYLGQPRVPLKTDKMRGSYLGPEYTEMEIRESLIKCGAVFDEKPFEKIVAQTAEFLSKGNAIGWFQGKMEFGPRSLGNRSILGDPRDPKTQSKLNIKIKFRESFRPFAPSILSEHVKKWFNLDCDSPYMLLVAPVNENKRTKNIRSVDLKDINHARSSVPAITHVDYSARVQTVHKETNPKFHKLISEFYALTSCPMVVNTSFNVRGEPIVLSPEDAFRCFMGTQLDVLVIGNFILKKTDQNQELLVNYLNEFELD
jgi:carbamoyltransferase